jgi:hypothetical protein
MIDLKNIVKTPLILSLRRIIAIVIIAGFALLSLISTKLFILLDEFLTIKLNFSFFYSIGIFAISYYFWFFLFKFIAKILDLYDNWR